MKSVVTYLAEARKRIAPCIPPLWARTGHLQTILGHLIASRPILEAGENLNVMLESAGEQIATTYLKGETRTVVYLFHGLGGTIESSYMRRTAHLVRQLGHHVFLNNHRGCGHGVGLAVEPYHSGRAEDLSKVIAFGREKLPGHFHIAIGFSLSANALLLLAAGVRADVLPDAAIAVNGPIDLDKASKKLLRGLNLIYNFNFLADLKKSIRERHASGRLATEFALDRVWSIRELDQVYTAPAGGFIDRDHYYKSCSAQQYLSRIKIPTVLLTAADDPFVDVKDYLNAATDLSPTTYLHIEKYGGHMGYLTRGRNAKARDFFRVQRWLDAALEQYVRALHQTNFV